MLVIDIDATLGSFALKARIEAPASGVLALFGPSGAGKSSIANAIAGLLRPDKGRIALGSTTLFDSGARINVPPERRGIGLVFQDARLFPHLTVEDNLLFGRKRAQKHGTKDGLDVSPQQVIDLLGLGTFLKRRPGTLSGGERQRVALGRALLARPRLLVLDEPLAALDTARRSEILDYLAAIKATVDLPMVLVSHAVDEVVRLADRVAVVHEGEVADLGSTGAVLATPLLARLSGAGEPMAVIDAVSDGPAKGDGTLTRYVFPGGVLALPGAPAPRGEHVRLRIWAREVILASQPPIGLSVRNALTGTVRDIASAGEGICDVTVLVGETTLVARITESAAHALELVPGLPVFALVKSLAVDRFGGTVEL